MKLNFRKKDIYFFIIALICLTAFFILMFKAFKKVDSIATNNSISSTPTIIIDAGHGGEDGGATGINGTFEKDINLKIAQNLESMLLISGFKTIMTRDDDYDISNSGLTTVRERKVSDLNNRLKLIESTPDCIFISIHQNKFSQSQYWGSQVFYSKNDDSSKILASNIREAIVSFLQPDNKREIKPADKNIYILYNSTRPAVLVECGFLSNATEEQKLNSEKYQKEMSFSIYSGFMNYWYSLN